MKTRTDESSSLIKKVRKWKKDQAIVSLSIDEMLKKAKGKETISEQKVDGQTGIMEFSGDDNRFGTLGGVIYWELPVLDEIKKILKSLGLHQAIIVGEMAGYENGKILHFNETESIIKNSKADKTKIHWFPYQILELENEEFPTNNFESYAKLWNQLKKMFSGAKFVHPVKDSENIKEAWDKFVLKEKNEGIVVRTSDNKVYKSKPEFTYDLVIIAVGSKKGKNWPKKQIGMTLMAFMDKDRVFRAAGHIGTGWTREQAQELFKWAQANKVGEDNTYVWVKPERIVEVQWERSSIREMDSFKYSSKGGYESVGKKISGTIVKPRFIRYRKDKTVSPNDLRLTQVPDWSEKQKMAHRVACRHVGGLDSLDSELKMIPGPEGISGPICRSCLEGKHKSFGIYHLPKKDKDGNWIDHKGEIIDPDDPDLGRYSCKNEGTIDGERRQCMCSPNWFESIEGWTEKQKMAHRVACKWLKYADDLTSMYEDTLTEFEEGKKHQKWDVVDRNKVIKVWKDFALTGDVTLAEIHDIYEQTLHNLKQIVVNSMIRDSDHVTNDNVDDWNAYIKDEKGHGRYTDQDRKFQKALTDLERAQTPKDKLLMVDRIFNLIHGSGPVANWFIEGGNATLSELQQKTA